MRFREGDILPKVIIHNTICLVLTMLTFIILCDFGFKEILEPYRTPLAILATIWLSSIGFILIKKV